MRCLLFNLKRSNKSFNQNLLMGLSHFFLTVFILGFGFLLTCLQVQAATEQLLPAFSIETQDEHKTQMALLQSRTRLNCKQSPFRTGKSTVAVRLPYQGDLLPSDIRTAFNIDEILAANLTDLKWVIDSYVVTGDNVAVVQGFFSPGRWVMRKADGFEGGGYKEAELNSKFELLMKTDRGNTVNLVTKAVHESSGILPFDPTNPGYLYNIVAASTTPIAIVRHGQLPNDWQELGWTGRSDLTNEGIGDVFTTNHCQLSDLQTSNFPWVLARTSMLAITLADRLLESKGYDLGEAALMGGSKEGYATWIAGAVDPRLVAIGPASFQRLNAASIYQYEYNSGCGPNGASKVIDTPEKMVVHFLFRDWLEDLKLQGTPQGRLFFVEDFLDLLYPQAIYYKADVGTPEINNQAGQDPGVGGRLRHDGTHYTMGADTTFLDNATLTLPTLGKAIRKSRYYFDKTALVGEYDGNKDDAYRTLFLLRLLLADDAKAKMDTWLKVQSFEYEGNGVFAADIVVQDGSPTPVVSLWIDGSPDREFNDNDQYGEFEWISVSMSKDPDGRWRNVPLSPDLLESPNQWVAFVQGEQSFQYAGEIITREDTSQILYVNELTPLACEDAALYPPYDRDCQ